MDTNDFVGSFAQENVSFTTQVVRTTSVGDNFMKVCIFTTDLNLSPEGIAALVAIPGSTYKALAVSDTDFASMTQGLLQSWLVDLYASGATYDTIIVSLGEGTTKPTTAELDAAYEAIKAYAFHKTIVVGATAGAAPAQASELDADLIKELIKLCKVDKQLLSSPVLLPYSTATPETPASDVVYGAAVGEYAFMVCHADGTRNAALFSLGLALSTLNGSGLPIGNSLDMTKTTNITSSGAGGSTLSKAIRDQLKALNIQTFKPVGNNSGAVAAIGDKTLSGDVYEAEWILAYVTYMTKVGVAELMTTPNFYKNEANYTRILEVMIAYINLFGAGGSGRLKDVAITAPAFSTVQNMGDSDEIVIPGAWEATYVNHVRQVTITGTLYISA